ncbi:MAG: PAS domain S-box protein [Oscillatoriales cyanobacterium SM2_1_8]|nr:PAS domain S-box protein [Oscillatoriales cyanobacterium SM2_1_8]
MADDWTLPQALAEIGRLQQRLRVLESEKQDLELLLETNTAHSDAVENQVFELNLKLEAEIVERRKIEAALRSSEKVLRALVTALRQEKIDLELLLETVISHSDTLDDLWFGQSKVADRHEVLFRAIAEAVPVGLMLCRSEDRGIAYANLAAGEILDALPAELVGHRFGDFLFDAESRRRFQSCLEDESTSEVYARRWHDGDRRWLSLSVAPLDLGSEAVLVLVFQDITAQKRGAIELQRAKETAENANRARNAFLSNMSHELRTPLNAIIGYCDLLTDEASEWGFDPVLPDLAKIRAAGQRQLVLIDDILEMCRLESGIAQLFWEEFDVCTLVTQISQRRFWGDGSRPLQIECDTAIGKVVSDVQKLGTILKHLLQNAYKFSQAGEVWLTVERDGSSLHFTVVDRGIGIPADRLEMLFEPFVQLDASTKRRYEGAGLGLAIAKRLAKMLGGTSRWKASWARVPPLRCRCRCSR